jgi:hypothetical protein
MLRQITIETLAFADDGRIKAAVDLHLKKLLADCVDRPGSDACRTLTLELFVTPTLDPDTMQCDDVNIEFQIGSKVPKHRSRPINCKVRKSHQGYMAMFNDLSEENADQRTLDEQAPNFVPPPHVTE